jgi:hypothetical protein
MYARGKKPTPTRLRGPSRRRLLVNDDWMIEVKVNAVDQDTLQYIKV